MGMYEHTLGPCHGLPILRNSRTKQLQQVQKEQVQERKIVYHQLHPVFLQIDAIFLEPFDV